MVGVLLEGMIKSSVREGEKRGSYEVELVVIFFLGKFHFCSLVVARNSMTNLLDSGDRKWNPHDKFSLSIRSDFFLEVLFYVAHEVTFFAYCELKFCCEKLYIQIW